MRINKTVLLLVTLGSAILVPLSYLKKNDNNMTSLSCQSRHTLLHGNFSLDANYSFTLGHKQGDLNINGIASEDGATFPVSRLIHFTWRKTENIYTLKTDHIEYLSSDKSQDSNVNHHYPSFFYEPGKSLTIAIERDKFDTPIIYINSMPIFYCKKYTNP